MDFEITEKEIEAVKRAFFKDGVLKQIPGKEKKRQIVLPLVAEHIEKGKLFSENEINDVIRAIYPQDCATLRRALVDAGYLQRDSLGKEYSRTDKPLPGIEEKE